MIKLIKTIIYRYLGTHTSLESNKAASFIGLYHLAPWVKISAEDILKYLSYFFQKTGFDILCKLSLLKTICMKCEILFS